MSVSPSMRPLCRCWILAATLATLPGCTLVEHWLDGGATLPAPAGEPVVDANGGAEAPGNGGPTAAEERCPLVFTEADANQAFAVIGGLDSDCHYDGVNVAMATMTVKWKPSRDAEETFTATLHPKDCGEGTVVGGLRVAIPDETRSRCPRSITSLEAALSGKMLPAGSYP